MKHKGLKITLTVIGGIAILYGSKKLYDYIITLKAAARYAETDAEKKLIINQVLISNATPVTDENINSYMKYTKEQLLAMLNSSVNVVSQDNLQYSSYSSYDYYGGY